MALAGTALGIDIRIGYSIDYRFVMLMVAFWVIAPVDPNNTPAYLPTILDPIRVPTAAERLFPDTRSVSRKVSTSENMNKINLSPQALW